MFRKPLRIFSRIVILWMMIGIWIPTMIQAVPGPGLVEPANGATGISTHPDLVWNTVDLSKSYQVQVSISETFSPLLVDTWDVYSNSYSLSGLITNTTYYWRIRAYLSVFFPDTTDWSKIWSFTTVTGSSITLVSPNGGEIWTTDSTYKIVWSPGTGITAVDLMTAPSGQLSIWLLRPIRLRLPIPSGMRCLFSQRLIPFYLQVRLIARLFE